MIICLHWIVIKGLKQFLNAGFNIYILKLQNYVEKYTSKERKLQLLFTECSLSGFNFAQYSIVTFKALKSILKCDICF